MEALAVSLKSSGQDRGLKKESLTCLNDWQTSWAKPNGWKTFRGRIAPLCSISSVGVGVGGGMQDYDSGPFNLLEPPWLLLQIIS